MARPRCGPARTVNAAGPRPDSFSRAGFSTIVVSLVSVPVGFISTVVVARALDPSAKGSYDLAVVCAGLTAMVIGLGLPGGIILAVARGLASPVPLLRVLLGIAMAQVVLAFVLLGAISVSPLTSALLPVDRSPLAIGMIAALVGAISALAYARSTLVGLQQIVSANYRDVWGRIATLALLMTTVALGGLLHYGATPLLILGLTVVGTILTCVFMTQTLLRVHLPRRGSIGLRVVLGYATPLYAGNLVQFLNYRLDLFLVAAFVGIREVGFYALAVALGQLLWIVSGSVAFALLPRVASGSAVEGAAAAARLTRLTLLIGVASAAALALIASPLVYTVYGHAYAEAVPPLLALLPGIVAFTAVNVLAAYFVGIGRLRINLAISVIGLCATLSLDFILIPRLGAVGAAIASTVSYSLSAIVTVGWAMKLAGLPARAFLLVQRADLIVTRNALRRLAVHHKHDVDR